MSFAPLTGGPGISTLPRLKDSDSVLFGMFDPSRGYHGNGPESLPLLRRSLTGALVCGHGVRRAGGVYGV